MFTWFILFCRCGKFIRTHRVVKMMVQNIYVRYCLLFLAVFSIIFLASPSVFAQTHISVKGLFKNTAVAIIDGQQRILKVGKPSPEGVLLISANSKEAVVEINGKRQTLYLGREVGTAYSAPEANEVRIAEGDNGHHWITGKINGRTARLLVDTGASTISMNSIEAKRLNVDYLGGNPVSVSTASGIARGFVVNLNSVTVGSITLNNISTIVLEGEFPSEILLGNSFLSEVNMKIEQGVLVLKAKY